MWDFMRWNARPDFQVFLKQISRTISQERLNFVWPLYFISSLPSLSILGLLSLDSLWWEKHILTMTGQCFIGFSCIPVCLLFYFYIFHHTPIRMLLIILYSSLISFSILTSLWRQYASQYTALLNSAVKAFTESLFLCQWLLLSDLVFNWHVKPAASLKWRRTLPVRTVIKVIENTRFSLLFCGLETSTVEYYELHKRFQITEQNP